MTGYKAYEDRHVVDLYPDYGSGVCGGALYNDTDFNATYIRSLLSEFKTAVLDDFAPGGQRIGPLPNLLYACSPRLLIRAPWRQIAFDCFTSTAAVISPLYAAVIWLLQYLPPNTSSVSTQRGRGRTDDDWGRYTKLNEDQGAFPLLPHSPTPATYSAPEQPHATHSLHDGHP